MEQKYMLPLWLAYPEIERYSIGWRMGYGEYYAYKWHEWYESLDEHTQNQYQELFPEPITWSGFYEDDDYCDGFNYNEYFMEYWQPDGNPKYTISDITQKYDNNENQKYDFFWKPYPSEKTSATSLDKYCFSQWYMSDFWSIHKTYCCMEQFMMANKAKLFADNEILEKIYNCNEPKKIFSLGRKVKNFDCDVWDKIKYSIVLNGNYYKFTQNEELRNYILSTGDSILVEASPCDAVWGIKMSEDNKDILNPDNWKGENLLGFALMEVRDEIKRVWKNVALCMPLEEE